MAASEREEAYIKCECSTSLLFWRSIRFWGNMRNGVVEAQRLIGREEEEGGALRESLDIGVIVRAAPPIVVS